MPASGQDTARDHALLSGIAWTAASRWIAQIISWFAVAYAARVITPADFGLAAMAGLAIGLARMVEDLGLDAVIVQDRALARDQIARLGGLAVLFGLVLASVFTALSGPIAGFFAEPAVAALVIVFGLTFITDALQIVPRALLQKDLAFRRLAWINCLQLIVQAGALAGFAAAGYAYWALVLNYLAGGMVAVVVLNLLRPHPLRWPRDIANLARPITFGARMIVSRIAWYGYSNADSTIAGKMLGKAALGAYQQSLSLATIPLAEVSSLVSRVVPGIFSEVQGDQAALRRYSLLLTEAIAIITLPMFAGIALVAEDAVPLILGPQWSESIVPLQVLCFYAALNALSVLVSHVLVWTGRARANMYLNLLALAVIPTSLYFGSSHGLVGIAWAWVIAFPLANIPAYVIVFRILDLRVPALLKALSPAAIATAAMVACVLFANHLVPGGWGHFERMMALIFAGLASYGAIAMVLYRDRVRALYQLLRMPRVAHEAAGP
jgi:O-antigen/teichoic acid export membrane protein